MGTNRGVFRPKLLVDTCALADRDFLRWLRGYHGEKRISAVSYMEYVTFLLDSNFSDTEIDRHLNNLKLKVESFDKRDAMCAAMMMHERDVGKRRCPECNQINWNDTMIASQGYNYSCIIVTENVRDYPQSDSVQVMTPQEIMESAVF